MIKGIYLKNSPHMDTVNLPQVFSEFNVLQEFKDAKYELETDKYKMIRREFWSDNFNIATYNISSKVGYDAMWRIYDAIQIAIPEFIAAWKYTDKLLIVAWPRTNDIMEDYIYKCLIEEIIRVCTWCLHEFFDTDIVADYIRDYFDLCVNYPNKNDDKD